jgi:hypothetical protein
VIGRDWIEFIFPTEEFTGSPIVLGEHKDLLCLHGVFLAEKILMDADDADRFRRAFDDLDARCLARETKVVAIKSGRNHYQVTVFSGFDTDHPEVFVRCSMNWGFNEEEATKFQKLFKHRCRCTVTIRNVPVPKQRSNECPGRTLNEAMELAVAISHGRNYLDRDAQFSADGTRRRQITTATNNQSDMTRTFMILFVLKAVFATLGLDFDTALDNVQQACRLMNDSNSDVPQSTSSNLEPASDKPRLIRNEAELEERLGRPRTVDTPEQSTPEQSTRLQAGCTGPIEGERFTGVMSQIPYACATVSLGPYSKVRLQIYEVSKSAQGASFYLALSAAVYKAIPNATDEELKIMLGDNAHFKSLQKLLKIGNKYASGAKADVNGKDVKALLASLLRSQGSDNTELEAAFKGISLPWMHPAVRQRASKSLKDTTMVEQVARWITSGESYCHELVVKVIKACFPFLKIIVVSSAGVKSDAVAGSESCIVHNPVHDITRDDYIGNRLRVVLHVWEGGGSEGGGSDGGFQHFEVAELQHDSDCWLEPVARGTEGLGSGTGHQMRQTKIIGFFTQRAETEEPRPSQDNVTCSRCGFIGRDGFQVFRCSELGCSESLCYKQLGMTAPIPLSHKYVCAEHRIGRPPAIRFLGKECFECHETKELVVCPCCGLALCKHHAMVPEDGVLKDMEREDLRRCRSCCENDEAFVEPRRSAALRLVQQIFGERTTLEKCCSSKMREVQESINRKYGLYSKQWQKVCKAADTLGAFVYSLIVCGLSVLAGSFLRILMQINLSMHTVARTMELRPLQFFYMMSFDPQSLCNGRMLAMVVQAFSEHIVQVREARRCEKDAAQQFPAISWADAAGDDGGRMNLAFCAHNLLTKSPTTDLAYGTLMHFASINDRTLAKYSTWIVVRTELTEEQGAAGECPYDKSYPPVVELATKFEGRILYLWSDWKTADIVNAMRSKHFRIVIHMNGLNHGHLWDALIMAEVAEFYLEWLSLASLLLCSALSHWTLTCRDLVTQTQLGMPGREAVLFLPFHYPNLAYYQKILNEKGSSPPSTSSGPGLIYAGGLERLTDRGFLHAVVDILHRAPPHAEHGRLKFRVQSTPISKLGEIRDLIKAYCEENKLTDRSWEDLSHLLVTYPYFDDKRQLIEWLWANGDCLIAISGGCIGPHTRTRDVTHAGIPTLTLTPRDAEWPARYAFGINQELGLGHVLNTDTREMFAERGTELLSRPECIRALRAFILDQQKKELWLFDSSHVAKYLMDVFPLMLNMIRTARSNSPSERLQLQDIDATNPEICQPHGSRPEFHWVEGIVGLGENTGMEASRIMCVLKNKGARFPAADIEGQFVAIVEYMQSIMHIDRVAGMGGAKVTLVGRLKEADSDALRRVYRELSLCEGSKLALKVETKWFLAHSIHNSEIVREAQAVSKTSTDMARSGMMKGCIPKLLALLHSSNGGTAAVGVHRSGEKLLPFLICEAVQEDLAHSTLLSEVQNAWKRGEINEDTRVLALMILHTAHYLAFYIGLVLMDHSHGNLFLLPADVTMPKLSKTVAGQLPGPGAVGWCDLGNAIYIGPWNQRVDARVRAPEALARQCTKTDANVPKGKAKTLINLKVNAKGIGTLGNDKLTQCEERRMENHGGLGRLEGATPGYYCLRLRALWKAARKNTVLTVQDISAWESFGNGALIYAFFCPKQPGVSREVYQAEQEYAALTPENMLETMLKYVDQDAQQNLQRETAASWANLLYHLMRPQTAERKPVSIARLHPALTNRALSLSESTRISSEEGLLCPGGCGPANTPWADESLPACAVKMQGHKGPGLVLKVSVNRGDLVAVYVAIEHSGAAGVGLKEYAPCRSNVSIHDGKGPGKAGQVAIGTLPLRILMELRCMGPCINASDKTEEINLTLDRNAAVTNDGLIFMPMYATVHIEEGKFVNWAYDPFNGQGGIDSYCFCDAQFAVDAEAAKSAAAATLAQEAAKRAKQEEDRSSRPSSKPRVRARGPG